MGFRDPQFYDDLLGHKDALSPLLVDYLSYIEILFILALDKQIKNTYIHAFGIDIQITFVTLNGVTDPQFCDDLLGHKDALTLSKTTNFRLFQIQRVCRRQFQM